MRPARYLSNIQLSNSRGLKGSVKLPDLFYVEMLWNANIETNIDFVFLPCYNPEFDTCEIKKWLQTQ